MIPQTVRTRDACPYPIGGIFITMNPEHDSPTAVAALWGEPTVWEAFAEGRALVGKAT
jgi:hypothetical protein